MSSSSPKTVILGRVGLKPSFRAFQLIAADSRHVADATSDTDRSNGAGNEAELACTRQTQSPCQVVVEFALESRSNLARNAGRRVGLTR